MISQISDGVFVFVGLNIYVVMKMEQKKVERGCFVIYYIEEI